MIRRGKGIACMWYPIGFTVMANPSAATVKVNTDGTATLLTGTVETGQGALTVLGQIAAETKLRTNSEAGAPCAQNVPQDVDHRVGRR